MSSLPVFAEASSKLHADIAMIRLLRAGLQPEQISAVFPRGRAPNAVCCWLNHFHRVPMASALPIAAAGPLGRLFREGVPSDESGDQMETLGLTSDVMARLVDKMNDGRFVVCVHARNEAEASIAWHVFEHVGADHVSTPSDHWDRVPIEAPAPAAHWAGIAA